MLIYEKVTDPMSFIFFHAKQNYEALLKTHTCHLCQQACFECRLVTKDELLIWSQALAYPTWPSNSSVWRWRHIELQPGLSRVRGRNAWQAQERLSGRLVELRIPCVENVPVQDERNNAARRSFRIRSDSYANPRLRLGSRILPTPRVVISGYATTENVFYCLNKT